MRRALRRAGRARIGDHARQLVGQRSSGQGLDGVGIAFSGQLLSEGRDVGHFAAFGNLESALDNAGAVFQYENPL